MHKSSQASGAYFSLQSTILELKNANQLPLHYFDDSFIFQDIFLHNIFFECRQTWSRRLTTATTSSSDGTIVWKQIETNFYVSLNVYKKNSL